MAFYIIFPNEEAFAQAKCEIAANVTNAVLDPPEFCHGLIAPALELTGGPEAPLELLRSKNIAVSGIIPAVSNFGDLPDSPPPHPNWRRAAGAVALEQVRESLTDSLKLHVEIRTKKSLSALIPFLPALIRGGAYNPKVPIFSFEEEHRLITFHDHKVIFSRVNNLPDLWIIVRTSVELLLSAWRGRNDLKPVEKSRLGIGAVELYKRLPGTNCGLCGHVSCTEFATNLFLHKTRPEDCRPLLAQENRKHLESLCRLMFALGLDEELAMPE